MIYKSGREFLDVSDELHKDTSFPGGGIEEGMPKLQCHKDETMLSAACGTLSRTMEEAAPRSKEERYVFHWMIYWHVLIWYYNMIFLVTKMDNNFSGEKKKADRIGEREAIPAPSC